MFATGMAVGEYVQLLLKRGDADDLAEAAAEIDRLAAVPTDPGFVLHELPLLRLRALPARGTVPDTGAKDYAGMANSLGFERHMALAAAMT
ncbi:MAG TPA: hypothetical protein VE197_13665, partial [Mycobacterium sp.]|nr:hypothetical protein [Mycobacterium sp.]